MTPGAVAQSFWKPGSSSRDDIALSRATWQCAAARPSFTSAVTVAFAGFDGFTFRGAGQLQGPCQPGCLHARRGLQHHHGQRGGALGVVTHSCVRGERGSRGAHADRLTIVCRHSSCTSSTAHPWMFARGYAHTLTHAHAHARTHTHAVLGVQLSQVQSIGGTSASAPMFAGLVSLLNEARYPRASHPAAAAAAAAGCTARSARGARGLWSFCCVYCCCRALRFV